MSVLKEGCTWDDSATLTDYLCKQVRAWVARVSPKIVSEEDVAKLEINLFGAAEWDDDGVPHITAKLVETVEAEAVAGPVPEAGIDEAIAKMKEKRR